MILQIEALAHSARRPVADDARRMRVFRVRRSFRSGLGGSRRGAGIARRLAERRRPGRNCRRRRDADPA